MLGKSSCTLTFADSNIAHASFSWMPRKKNVANKVGSHAAKHPRLWMSSSLREHFCLFLGAVRYGMGRLNGPQAVGEIPVLGDEVRWHHVTVAYPASGRLWIMEVTFIIFSVWVDVTCGYWTPTSQKKLTSKDHRRFKVLWKTDDNRAYFSLNNEVICIFKGLFYLIKKLFFKIFYYNFLR